MSIRAWFALARNGHTLWTQNPEPRYSAFEALEPRLLLNTYTVTSLLGDASPGTLAWAIQQANDRSGADIIEFASQPTGNDTILEPGLPILMDDVTIRGPGPDLIKIDLNRKGRAFVVSDGVRAEISGITIKRCRGPLPEPGGLAPGGAIMNRGHLRMNDCVLLDNKAQKRVTTTPPPRTETPGVGGAIWSKGSLHLQGVTFLENEAQSVGDRNNKPSVGGAVYVEAGLATFRSCSFVDNRADHGSGIFVSGEAGPLTIEDCTIESKSMTVAEGVRIYAATARKDKISFSTIAGHAFTGVWYEPSHPNTELEVVASEFSGNLQGLALKAAVKADATVRLLCSTMWNNHQALFVDRYALDTQAKLDVFAYNCTFSGNDTGVWTVYPPTPSVNVTLLNCTVTDNKRGVDADVDAYNSVVAGNTINPPPTWQSQRKNFVGADPKLSALVHVGIIPVHHPLENSPLIDGGSSAKVRELTKAYQIDKPLAEQDQRGAWLPGHQTFGYSYGRFKDSADGKAKPTAKVDIGAVERGIVNIQVNTTEDLPRRPELVFVGDKIYGSSSLWRMRSS